jgi:hypothetical protein
MSVSSYRVRGTLLATRSAECFLRQLDVADVEHDLVEVDLAVQATEPQWAAQDASWIAADTYATWRWREAPTIEEVER